MDCIQTEPASWGGNDQALMLVNNLPHAFAEWASRGQWTAYRHLAYTGLAVAKAVRRKRARLIVNMPGGVGKTELLSHWCPLWLLRENPALRLILAANTDPRARKHGRWVRNEAMNNPRAGVDLSDDSRAKSVWHTREGGGMVCVGVGTAALGERANVFLIDDPYRRWADAYSGLWRDGLQDWFHSTLKTRLEPDASVIIIHHRIASDDLTGYLMESQPGEWEVIRLPALAEPDDPMGRLPGEALCPERFDRAHYEHERSITPAQFWAAMYQQAPLLVGAGAVYDRFGEWNLDGTIKVRKDLPLLLTLDFNINPGMHGLIVQYDSRADMFTFITELHGPRMTVRDLCGEFAVWRAANAPEHEVQVFGDASGSAERAGDGKSDWSIVSMGLAGIKHRQRVPAKNPPVVDRVNAVNDALKDAGGVARVKVHPSCVRLIEDLRKQRRDEDGQPEKANQQLGHSGDAAGYLIHYLRPTGGPIRLPRGKVGYASDARVR